MMHVTPLLAHGVGGELHLTRRWLVRGPGERPCFPGSCWDSGYGKWALWTFFAFKLSRRNMKSLGFLGRTASAFAPVAAAAVIGATWREEILHDGARSMDFKLPAIALVVIIALVALGPRLFCSSPGSPAPERNPGIRSTRPNAEQGLSREMDRSARRVGN